MSGVTAIIARFYPERLGYLDLILKSLSEQTVRPLNVLIWNNFKDRPRCRRDSCDYFDRLPDEEYGLDIQSIHFSANSLMGRWAAVVLAETEYVLILDDDLIVGPDTIEKLLTASEKHFGALVGPFGMNFGPDPSKPYTSGKRVHEGPVDVVLGRCLLASKLNLLRRLSFAGAGSMGRNDDILLSAAGELPAYAVPGISFTNLDEKQTGLSHEEGHMAERDAAARLLIGVRI